MRWLFLAGLALTGSHLLVGLLVTPFFGDGPFLWSQIMLSLVLSIAGGLLLGLERLHRGADKGLRRHNLFTAAGLIFGASPILLAPWVRTVLDANPTGWITLPLALGPLLSLPGSMLVALVPLALADPSLRRGRLGRHGVLIATLLGAASGIAFVAPLLLWPEASPQLALGGLGWLALAGATLEADGKRRLALLFALALSCALALFCPGELQSLEYRNALHKSFKRRVGRYYLATAGRRVLERSDLKAHFEEILKEIETKEDRTAAAVLLTVEMLREMGPVQTTGAGLMDTLRPLLPEDARRFVFPLLEPYERVNSDGRGAIHFVVKPGFRNRVLNVPWNARADEDVFKFVIRRDFTLLLRQRDRTTNIEVEPKVVERAGFFEVNETHTTPLEIQDVKYFVDASVLGIRVENERDRVKIFVKAQGSLGPVVDQKVAVITK